MKLTTTSLLADLILLLIQVLAAIPWLLLAFRTPGAVGRLWQGDPNARRMLNYFAGAIVMALAMFLGGIFLMDTGYLETSGLAYGFLLQLQLTIDFFILFFPLLLWVWPKGGAVAQAAFREGVRQPMFWLLFVIAFGALSISPFIPYFTFGEDHIMVKELGYDTIMLFATVFGALAASTSIGEEIEGRTAVTLMSKPVSRRQFVLGKFLGILMAALLMFGLLGCYFEAILLYKAWWDRLDPVPKPDWVVATVKSLTTSPDVSEVLRGICLWIDHAWETLPGLILTFFQVMVLLAVAVTLAIRVPMVINIVTVVSIYFLAHLTPNLVAIGKKTLADDPNSAVGKLLEFTSQVFEVLLPALQFFRTDPALMSDAPLPTGQYFVYVGSVAFYGVLYTLIILLLGLIFFEDRDLA
jgi:ABC-type transport system involved in multi-copper enzyme maturation permease subunit